MIKGSTATTTTTPTPKRVYYYCPTCHSPLHKRLTKEEARKQCTTCQRNQHCYTVTCNNTTCTYYQVFDCKHEAKDVLGHVSFDHRPSLHKPNAYFGTIDSNQCPMCLDKCAIWEERMNHLFQKDATTVTVHDVIIGYKGQLVCAHFYGKIVDTSIVRDTFTATVRLFARRDMPFSDCFGVKGYRSINGMTFAFRDPDTGAFYAKVVIQCDPNDLRNTGNALYTGTRCKSRCKDPCTYHTLGNIGKPNSSTQ